MEFKARGVPCQRLTRVEAAKKVGCKNSWPAEEGQYLDSYSIELTRASLLDARSAVCPSPAFCLTREKALLCLSLDRTENCFLKIFSDFINPFEITLI